jgi:hypothetical protein
MRGSTDDDADRSGGAGSPIAVVVRASSQVGKDLVGLGDLTKASRSLGVLGVCVGVGTLGETPVGLDDLGIRRVRPYLEASEIVLVRLRGRHRI